MLNTLAASLPCRFFLVAFGFLGTDCDDHVRRSDGLEVARLRRRDGTRRAGGATDHTVSFW